MPSLPITRRLTIRHVSDAEAARNLAAALAVLDYAAEPEPAASARPPTEQMRQRGAPRRVTGGEPRA